MRVRVFSLAFANPSILRAGWGAFWATTSHGEYDSFTAGDAHYPLHRGRIRGVLLDLESDLLGIKNPKVVDLLTNEGLDKNYQKLVNGEDLADEDLIVLFDADEYPAHAGWLTAFRLAMEADQQLGWLTLSSALSDENCERVGYSVQNGNGVRVQIPNDPVINAVCCFRVGALKATGGFHEPREYYGFFEIDMWPKFKAAGYKMGCLMDYRLAVNTLGTKHDALYTQYKRVHVGVSHEDYYKGSFEEWLKENPV